MDPYIETSRLWGDFHDDLIAEIKHALAAVLPERYFVRTDTRSYLEVDYGEDESKPPLPDAVVGPRENSGSVECEAFRVDRYRENFVEIREAGGEERLVTCIEALSPSNKRPDTEGWNLFWLKRRTLLLGAANFVEIDLLRGGTRMPMLTPWPTSPYYMLLCRRRRAPYCTAWPAGFRERLPVVPVPLDDPDPDIMLDIQPMVEAIYERSRYARSIDYTKELAPPLAAEDVAWVAELLKKGQAQQ
jgi:hypothetical protein